MSPDEIRDLRGDMTRAEFAEIIGVTPLTIYRWELAEDEKESRRPRRRFRERLEYFAETGRSSIVEPKRAPVISARPLMPRERVDAAITETEHAMIAPVLESILNARWSAAENALMSAFSTDRLTSPGGQVLAQAANGLLKLLWRNDVRGAYAGFGQTLRDLERLALPAEVAVPAHTLAALLFASPDGRIFNPGRVNAHVAQAEHHIGAGGFTEFHTLLRCAEMWAAFHLDDASLHERLRVRNKDVFKLATTPLARWMAWEVGTLAAHLSGCVVEAGRFFQELVDGAKEDGLAHIAIRGTAFLARLHLFGSEPVERIADAVEEAQRLAWRERIEPGYAGVLLNAAQAEILSRRGQFDEALRVIEDSFVYAERAQWPPLELFITHSRVLFFMGLSEDARVLPQRYAVFEGGHRQELIRAIRGASRAMGAFGALNMIEASEQFTESGRVASTAGTLPALEEFAYALAFYTAVLSQNRALEEETLRTVELSLERVPLYWIMAAVKLFRALRAALDDRPSEAAQLAEAAMNAFARVEDQAQLLLANRMRAAMAFVLEEPDAAQQLEDSAQRFEELGVPIPAPYTIDAITLLKKRRKPLRDQCKAMRVSELATPIERLALHGVSSAQILEELCDVLESTAQKKDIVRSIWLDELASEGRVLPIRHIGEDAPQDYLEFGDGCGRRFRIGVSGKLNNEERAAFSIIVKVTSLSLEVAALRAITNPAGTSISDNVPELPGFIAASESTRSLVGEIARLGNSRANVLIQGESGAGKEVVAHAVHKLSHRSGNAFVTFNCAAVPRDLFEGQLFGYRKGAFTGATSSHPGVIRAADGGTLFLDEIGDLPLELQPKLLRFLENGEVFPLGETRPVHVDVRVIAATHMNLAQMVRTGDFREDLYYRLAVVPLELPPLRDRKEDILALARHFIALYQPEEHAKQIRLSPEAASQLMEYDWPGNVRELRNVIERSLAFSPLPEVLGAQDLRF